MKIKCSKRILASGETASTDKLVGIIQSWVKMIENYKNSGKKYPESVISDLYSSMKSVLKRQGGYVNANTSIQAGYAPDDILWVLDEDNTWKTWGSAGPRIKAMSEDELLESLNSNGNNYIDVLITKNGENPDDYGRTEAIKDPFVKASTRPVKASTSGKIPYDLVSMLLILRDWTDVEDGYINSEHKALVDIADTLYNVGGNMANHLSPEYKVVYDKYGRDYFDQVLDDASAIDSQISRNNVGDLIAEYNDKSDTFEGKVTSATKSMRKTPIKAATDEYMLSEVLGDRESYIQEWQEASDGEPNTSWDNIFDNVVNDFELYCGDEMSGMGTDLPITERFNHGLLNERDIATEFADWVQWIDLPAYDY